MHLYEGDKVEVLISPLDSKTSGFVECRFENLVGMFPIKALKLLKKSKKAAPDEIPPVPQAIMKTEQQKSKLKLNERKKKKARGTNKS
jgi:hypothetical protein